jgi:hypothetical protein
VPHRIPAILAALTRLDAITENAACGVSVNEYAEADDLVTALMVLRSEFTADPIYTAEALNEMRRHLGVLAGVDADGGQPAAQHALLARRALFALRSHACFNM